MLGKIKELPHDFKAEMSVLSWVIMENSLLYEYEAIWLRADDFFSRDHEKIYEVILKLEKNIDIVTLCQALWDKYQSQVMELATHNLTTSNCVTHAQIVKEMSIYRNTIRCADSIKWMAMEKEPVGNILQEIKDTADWLIMSKTKKTYQEEVDSVYTALGNDIQSDLPIWFEELDAIMWWWLVNWELTTIAARPWVGKTAFMINMITNILENKKKRVWFFSLEMKSSVIIKRIICKVSWTNTYALRKKYSELDEEVKERIVSVYDDVAWLNMQLVDNDFDVENIVSTAKSTHIKCPYDCIFIDYLQIIKSRQKFWNENVEIGYISRWLKRLAMELSIPVIIGSQLSRDIERRRDPTPKLSDLRGSWSIEQDSDNVIFLNRDETMEEDIHDLKVIVAKQRNGATWNIDLKMHMPTMSIYTPNDDIKAEEVRRETPDWVF